VEADAQVDERLLEKLRAWRLETAQARDVPAYVVFHNRTLREIAAQYPTTREALLAVKGVGPHKLAQYGDDLLALILVHLAGQEVKAG
jgi:superfamily II DNA helicase RecQ